ncbi:MAG: hypothetical protein ACKO6N_10975 [Myxococcota bacterium]
MQKNEPLERITYHFKLREPAIELWAGASGLLIHDGLTLIGIDLIEPDRFAAFGRALPVANVSESLFQLPASSEIRHCFRFVDCHISTNGSTLTLESSRFRVALELSSRNMLLAVTSRMSYLTHVISAGRTLQFERLEWIDHLKIQESIRSFLKVLIASNGFINADVGTRMLGCSRSRWYQLLNELKDKGWIVKDAHLQKRWILQYRVLETELKGALNTLGELESIQQVLEPSH